MADPTRSFIAVLALSAAGLVGIAVDESYTGRAVPDPVKGVAVPTIGFGSTGPDVRMGDTTTPAKALARLRTDVQGFEGVLRRCVRVPLHQYEYDAYVNLAYNIGPDAFCGSTLVRRLNAGEYAQACEAILMWKRSGGVDCSLPGNKVCAGLWARRLRLHQQCLGAQAGVAQ